MGEVVNLRQARKARRRADKAAEADRNRLSFGRSETQARLADAERRRRTRDLDAHRIDAPAPADDRE